jgi:hypothetical protein
MWHVRFWGEKVFTCSHSSLYKSSLDRFFVLPLWCLDGVKVGTVQVESPVRFAATVKDSDVPMRVNVRLGQTQCVWMSSCHEGLPLLNCTHLDKLMSVRKMAFPVGLRPTRELDMCKALMKDIDPDMTDEAMAAVLQKRGKTAKAMESSLLEDLDNLGLIENGLDEDDWKIIKKVAGKLAEEKVKPAKSSPAAAKTSPAIPHAGGHEAHDASSKAWKPRPFPDESDDISLADAQTYCPPGSHLAKDPKRFSRWSGKYPKPSPPTHVTKSWGPKSGLSVRSSLFHVLGTLWAWHKEQTGQDCPWQFV